MKKTSMKTDDKFDKKNKIKPGSKRDQKIDKKRGVKEPRGK